MGVEEACESDPLGLEFLDMPPGIGSGQDHMDDFLQSLQTCTHRHYCNPPGPDNTHTHKCSHTHTQLLAHPDISGSTTERLNEEVTGDEEGANAAGRKRPVTNREAVRKYRERKKQHTAQLSEQLEEQKSINQQLIRRLSAQTALESEVVRLRCLLSEIRGKLDSEMLLERGLVNRPGIGISGHGTALSGVHVPVEAFLPGGEYYLQTVELPCEPQAPCAAGVAGAGGQERHRVWRHATVPAWPACEGLAASDVANGQPFCTEGKADPRSLLVSSNQTSCEKSSSDCRAPNKVAPICYSVAGERPSTFSGRGGNRQGT